MDKQLKWAVAAILLLEASMASGQILAPILEGGKGTATNTLVAHWNMVAGATVPSTSTVRVYNVAYKGPRTNYAVTSDDYTTWTVTANNITSHGLNQVVFGTGVGSVGGKQGHGSDNSWASVNSTWTITADAEVPTGTGEFQLGFQGSSNVLSGNFALTTSWQTFSWTWTGTAGSYLIPLIANGTDGAARTVNVRHLRMNHSATDLGYEFMPVRDGWFGNGPGGGNSNNPAYNSTGLNYGSGNNNLVYIPGNYHYTSITFYGMFKYSGTPVTANVAPLLSVGTSNIMLAKDTATYPYPTVLSGSQVVAAYGALIDDGNFHVMTGTFDGATGNGTIYVDGVWWFTGLATLGVTPAINTQFLDLANANSNGFPGEIDDFMLFSALHSSSQIAANTAAMWAEVAGRGINPPTLSKFLVVDGDSISDPSSGAFYYQKYPYVSAATLSPFLQNRTFAVSGRTCVQDDTAAPTTVDTLVGTGNERALFIFCGTNDIQGGATAAQTLANLKQYVADRRTAGWTKIGVGDMLPRNADGSFNTTRDAFNVLLAADHSWADAYVDWASDPTMGCDSCASNTTYYNADGIHPTAAGHAIIATYLETALPSLLP